MVENANTILYTMNRANKIWNLLFKFVLNQNNFLKPIDTFPKFAYVYDSSVFSVLNFYF